MHFRAKTTGVVLASSLTTIAGHCVRALSGETWTLSSAALNTTVPASFPSHAHLDLFKAGIQSIDVFFFFSHSPSYHGLNDFKLRWIADANWTYTSGPISDLLNEYESTWLVFDGLDTFAAVTFCDEFIASTDNQFRQYAFDISSSLRNCKGDPVLSINFGSAPNIVNAIAEDPKSEKWPIQLINEYPNRWFMRKEQSDFGWDWGPAFAPAGPWKPGHIVQFEETGNIHISSSPGIPFIEITNLKSSEVLTARPLDNITVSNGSIQGVTVLSGLRPEIWWPSGLGDQNLYNISIMVNDSHGQILGCVTKRTGFRTIFLNQRNITIEQLSQGVAPGANWHFEVNGKEFYAKGSNFIPPDAFWPRVSQAKMTRLFDAVVAGNQNILRIWSSGAYLPDFMYDLADERGILLWSEFQFSDAMYPVNDEFLENIAAEVVYNVRRVNHHPSLALWAGGNEIEILMLPLTFALDPTGFPKYLEEYEKLYISLILPLVYENTHSISYTPSSTTEGYIDVDISAPVPMTERYGNLEPGSYYGDTDYYEYNTKVSFDYWLYPVGRFANEFGFHSMPSLQTWQQAIDPEDLSFNSTVVMLRNHHYPPGGLSTDNFQNTALGMGEMTLGVERYYPIPAKSDPVANFSAWCHATQLFQADVYKSQIQFYRRGSGMPERQLGSLYWQLEDIWQAPTWAGIEYDGRWKVLHYVSRDIYQPIIVSPFWNYVSGDFEIYVTSDLWESANGTVKLTWFDLSGHPIAHNAGTPTSISFDVGAINTTKIYSANVKRLGLASVTDSILMLSLRADGRPPNAANLTAVFTHDNHFTPAFPKDLALVDPQLEVMYNDLTDKFVVEAKSGVSLYTWLDYPAGLVGYFEENAFVLHPGQKKEIGFITQENSTDSKWQQKVTVSSLWDQKVRD
ncbi:hypothetical protein ARAM_001087 [Aspergillus rambellii]|uniref:Beta-mannosidase A n=1 Tax=Aspergillus rambellii TaxID=308745 RepID=A0A0F8UCJ9_9EURO|nr:hypothetical protein ARAM_001087 [Aspergillus rambellii]